MSLIHEEEFDKRHPVDWKAGHDGDTNVIANLRARVAELEAALSRRPAAADKCDPRCKCLPEARCYSVPAEQPAAEPELMPLPEPRAIRAGNSFPKVYALAYTADQMQEYALAHLRAAGQGKESERLDADSLREPKNGAEWNVHWWNESMRLMLPADSCIGHINHFRNGTMVITIKRNAAIDAAMKAGAQGGGK